MTTLKLDWCSHEAAKYAVEHWHYSKTMPVSKNARIGVWEDGQFIGAIVFALGASANLGSPYGLTGTECCELVRVALSLHASPVSRMIAIALKMMKRQSPGLRLVVSFADVYHGHHGGIYQASNWVYAGRTSSATMVSMPNGDLLDPRRFNGHGNRNAKWGRQPKRSIPLGATIIKVPPKHRYLMPLDDAMRKQIAPLAKPYPKRVTRDTGETDNAAQSNEQTGGASPTVSLL